MNGFWTYFEVESDGCADCITLFYDSSANSLIERLALCLLAEQMNKWMNA